jgi:putative flavoprotein involved in K+ transport
VQSQQHSPAQDAACLDVLVVGAGQAGLAVGWHLAKAGLRFLMLEAAPQLGQSWRSRWDSLRLFTPREYDGLPGMAFPGPPGTYPGKDDVADYLEQYAARFELPVLLNTRVTSLTRRGDHFVAATTQGALRARQVVVATGAFQHPVVPEVAGRFDRSVRQLHSAEYRNPGELPRGKVLVVGAGNSGLQIAGELADTHDVEVAAGSGTLRLPQRLVGRDLFWWLDRTGLMRASVDTPLGRRIRSRGELVIGTKPSELERSGVDFRPRLVGADGRTARFADSTSTAVDVVVWATGFRADYSWIEVPGVTDGREVSHRRGVTSAAGLYFVGLPWQHTRGSALLGFVEDDAEFVSRAVLSHHSGGRVNQARPGPPHPGRRRSRAPS